MFYKRFFNLTGRPRRIYLDYASSTPVDETMLKSFPAIPPDIAGANPSALHREGVALKRIMSEARGRVAAVLHAHADEIIFTSGATESDNLAIQGSINYFLQKGIAPHEIAIYIGANEHAAVVETAKYFETLGVTLAELPLYDGVVHAKDIVLAPETKAVLISVMYVNNEVGTVQPIRDIAKRVRHLRKHNPEVEIIFHCDATQALLYYDLNVAQLGVDLMTLGATKLYTPKGVGMLYKKRTITLAPIIYGGGQEYGLRPGTPAVELIHLFSYSLELANKNHEQEMIRIRDLQIYFETEIVKIIPEAKITCQNSDRSPHISHVAIPGIDSELLVIELDARGIAVSAKSACKNENDSESEIVESMYGKNVGAVRFSFGRWTTKKQLNKAIRALQSAIKKYW